MSAFINPLKERINEQIARARSTMTSARKDMLHCAINFEAVVKDGTSEEIAECYESLAGAVSDFLNANQYEARLEQALMDLVCLERELYGD